MPINMSSLTLVGIGTAIITTVMGQDVLFAAYDWIIAVRIK